MATTDTLTLSDITPITINENLGADQNVSVLTLTGSYPIVANTVAASTLSPLPTVTGNPAYFGTFSSKSEILHVSALPKTLKFESPCTIANSAFIYTLSPSLPSWI